jgi:hypothetical protein
MMERLKIFEVFMTDDASRASSRFKMTHRTGMTY